MSRSSRAAAVIVGAILCIVLCLLSTLDTVRRQQLIAASSGDKSGDDDAEQPASSKAADSRAKDLSGNADRLFEQSKWSEARTVYDRLLVESENWSAPDVYRAVDRSVICSLRLRDFDGALREITAFRAKRPIPDWDEVREWRNSDDKLAASDSEIMFREFNRKLLEQIARDTPAVGYDQFRRKVRASQVAVDLEIVRFLDPEVVPAKHHWGWGGRYPEMDWWWISAKRARSDSDEGEPDWREGIPLAADGHPAFLQAPATFRSKLGRAQKILCLLSEIERLDPSATRDSAAQALLYRADIARRLYGPIHDPTWGDADFIYRTEKRPAFSRFRARQGLKEFWQLGDDEARTLVGGRLQIITLPPAESPLALWSRVEKECPQSNCVAEAIYQRGMYYQNRRQFTKAIEEYRKLTARFPTHTRAKDARNQIGLIEHADVILGRTGIYASGTQPTLWFACRNTGKTEFTARRFDLKRYIANRAHQGEWYAVEFLGENLFLYSGSDREYEAEEWKKLAGYLGSEMTHWSESAPLSNRIVTHTTRAPLLPVGAYFVEARVPGRKEASHGLVVVTDIAIIQKSLPGKVLLWVVNPRTGQPLAGQKLDIHPFSRDSNSKRSQKPSLILTTDAQGIVEFTPHGDDETFVEAVTEAGGMASAMVQHAGQSDEGHVVPRSFGVTDRPLYRPGSTVHFRIWFRELASGHYRPAQSGVRRRVELHGPSDRNPFAAAELVTDESGSVIGSFQLSTESPLGRYRLTLEGFERTWGNTECEFRVEEYKKPEFEVAIQPTKHASRLGDVIKASVQARYYFGAPVSGARLHYRVTASDFRARYAMPSQWDWLYGNGFGDYEYAYRWLGDVDMQEAGTQDSDENDDDDSEKSETVAEGTMRLDANGSAEIRIDTATAPRDRDRRYTIHVEVRDESRRTIEATETVVATRQQFHAFMELDRGWYEPGSQAAVDITTRSSNNAAVNVDGKLILYHVKPTAPDSASRGPEQEVAGTWNVSTGAGGHVQLPAEGQYRLAFKAQDAWHEPVTALTNLWVYGPKFDGRQHRFGQLEVIPDRRWYKVGDTARMLLNTSYSHARLLMFDSLNHYWFVDIPDHTRLIEIPISEKHVPNYFIQATLVADGEAHTETCELFVPPIHDVVQLELRPNRLTYKSGEKGSVSIQARDLSGMPISGSMTLTAYDKSLSYFQIGETESPRSLLISRRNWFSSSAVASTVGPRLFSASGKFICPEFHLDDAEDPPAGGMGGMGPSAGAPSDQKEPEKGSQRHTAAKENDGPKTQSARLIEPELRKDFSDTAAWLPNLVLDQRGRANAEIVFPESLTTWRICGYVVTKDTQVGDATAEVTTSKPLLVRLQTPRFMVEGDQLILSANVHNDLSSRKEVSAELIVPAALFELAAAGKRAIAPDKEGNLHLITNASIDSHAQRRFDWPLKARSEGLASITARALTDEASDAMRFEFPVRPRGTIETQSHSGMVPADDLSEKSLTFDLPPKIVPDKTRIELSLAPTTAGSLLEAIPFLASYPYGCVEQTMSRFYPTVLATDALRQLKIDLKSLGAKAHKGPATHFARHADAAVFDPDELRRMAEAGLERLYRFQHDDGGWGWWEHDDSKPFMTAYVLLGLNTAANAGIRIKEDVYGRAVQYLAHMLQTATESIGHPAGRQERALICYVLSLERSSTTTEKNSDGNDAEKQSKAIQSLFDSVFADRDKLNRYGQALLALSLHHRHDEETAKGVLREILVSVRVDQTHALAWVPTSRSEWWHWFNNETETNACILRAIVAIDPKNSLAPQIANWLVANRSHGQYWSSTRDTAQAVHALAEYLCVSQGDSTDFSVNIVLDGRKIAQSPVSSNKGLVTGIKIEVDGKDLTPGHHQITLTKSTRGPLYYSMTVQSFNRSENGKPSGNGIHLTRRFLRRGPVPAASPELAQTGGSAASPRSQLDDRDVLKVGDTVEIELTFSSDEDHEYVAFEDPKPAGFEPVQLQSGYTWGNGFCSNVELRDEEVLFFAEWLPKGKHVLSYTLRAEIPGKFQARSTRAFDMYNPQIHASSGAMRLQIRD